MFIRPLTSIPSFMLSICIVCFERLSHWIVAFFILFLESSLRLFTPSIIRNVNKPVVSYLETASSFEDMIKFWQLDYKEYFVKTKDNYRLCLHRINLDDSKFSTQDVSDKEARIEDQLDEFKKTPSRKTKPVVLLFHGLTLTSEVWISNVLKERNLPLYLAERGFDVWLGNTRGNRYSRFHTTKDPNNLDFWDFSMNEYAYFDLPNTIQFILEETGASDLSYIGFSQGTAQAFAGLSVNPELNQKVNLFIALAPAATPKGFHHPILDRWIKHTPELLYTILGRKIFLESVLFWQALLEPDFYVTLIDKAVHFLFGWHGKNISFEQKKVGYQHLFNTTSVKSIVHWFQIISSGQFQTYQEKDQPFAEKFPLNQIKSPMAIFYGSDDTLVDFNLLRSELPKLAYVKNIHGWEHMDFLWADGLESRVYPDILKLLNHFNL